MITRSREYLGDNGLPPADMLRCVLAEHRAGLGRLKRLRAMYDAKGPILDRRRREGLPNNKLAHPYAHYITTIATGYLIGQPVAYSTAEESPTLLRIQDAFRKGSEAAENTHPTLPLGKRRTPSQITVWGIISQNKWYVQSEDFNRRLQGTQIAKSKEF